MANNMLMGDMLGLQQARKNRALRAKYLSDSDNMGKDRRERVPMSPPRADMGTVKPRAKRLAAGSPMPATIVKGNTTTVPMSPPRADMGKPKLSAFGRAFRAAKAAGKKTFTWSGKRYTTKVK